MLSLLRRYFEPTAVVGTPTEVTLRLNPDDKREFHTEILANGLKVTFVYDPGATSAAANLSVAAGFHNDPPEWPGLAHYCEHMLFMGCNPCLEFGDEQAIPAGEYETFIRTHNGIYNAATSAMETNYNFALAAPSGLEGALKRLSRFFITPAFDAKYCENELSVVNSEFELKREDEGMRFAAVLSQICNQDHPASQFLTGNKISLDETGKSSSLRNAVINFFNDFYGAERMALCVVAPVTIADQRAMVEEYFSHIPRGVSLKANRIPNIAFTPNETGKMVHSVALKPVRELTLAFPFPSGNKKIRKAADYLIIKILDRQTGGLYKFLRDKNFINAIEAGGDYSHSHMQDLFKVKLILTDQGLANIDEIVAYVFAYIRYLQQNEPDDATLTELQEYHARDLKFITSEPPLNAALELTRSMQTEELNNIYFANKFEKSRPLEPNLINQFYGYLRPENMLLLIHAKQDGDKYSTEPYYQVKYCESPISSQQYVQWSTTPPDAMFSPRPVNDMLPTNFELCAPDSLDPNLPPQTIIQEQGAYFWHKQDKVYKLPKLEIRLFVIGKEIPLTAAMRQALYSIVEMVISEACSELYMPLTLAGVTCSANIRTNRIEISVSSYNHHAEQTISTVLNKISEFKIDSNRFPVYKQLVKERFATQYKASARAQGSMALKSILLRDQLLFEKDIEALDGITESQVQQVCTDFFSEVQVQGLFYGNVSHEDAVKLGRAIMQQLNCQPSERKLTLEPVMQLRKGQNLQYDFYYPPAIAEDGKLVPAHCVIGYYQAHDNDLKTHALTYILAKLLQPRIFKDLRSDHKLGYAVFTDNLSVSNNFGIVLEIESCDHDAVYIQHMIDSCLNRMSAELAKITETELNTIKNAYVAMVHHNKPALTTDTDFYWAAITDGDFDFRRERASIQAATTITLADLQKHFYDMFLNQQSIRCITVKTPGQMGSTVAFESSSSKATEPAAAETIHDIAALKMEATFSNAINLGQPPVNQSILSYTRNLMFSSLPSAQTVAEAAAVGIGVAALYRATLRNR